MTKQDHYRKLFIIGDKDNVLDVLAKLKNWEMKDESNALNMVKTLTYKDNKIWFDEIKEIDGSNTIILATMNVTPQENSPEESQPKTVYEDGLFNLYKDIHTSKLETDDISISITLSDYELMNN